ncbi:quinolinate synthase NadA [Candidatus Bathyarchaeota archaeon]|nr:quinolinate synthase NadA [Candidatus Bathyarchaeota archaeon]
MRSYRALIDKINALKREKRAVILAHNYQRAEIQEIADYIGDSVGLSRKAMEVDAEIILFSAVDFMAETAAVLNPDKKVLIPSLGARCPMAAMLQIDTLKEYRRRYPKVPLVLYVNTLAEAKAECDVCCTSANAVEIVEALDSDTVLFGPDCNLARYVTEKTGKTVIPVPESGFCPTHVLFLREDVLKVKEEHSGAVLMAHPECRPEVWSIADYVGSTSQMSRFVKSSKDREFIIATEVGLLHRLRRENPEKGFIPAYEDAICVNMKINTLEKLYLALRDERYSVKVPENTATKAREAIMRMFELTE